MEGIEIVLIIIGVMIILWFINDSIEIESEMLAVEKNKCGIHKWAEHEVDGHMYCEVCKQIPLQNDNGERT